MEKIPRRIIRRMGFIKERQGLIDRYINVGNAWEGHLAHTRNFILKAVSGKKFNNLAVLGSGWLLDLPLEDLINHADHIQLYDITHPVQAIHRLQKYPQIRTISCDITGGAIVNTWHAVRDHKKTGRKALPEEICKTAFHPGLRPDYIISLNILSQIGEMISTYLKRHVPYDPEEINRINFLLQQAHLKLLTPGKSCLITDFKELSYDFSDQLMETTELINIALPSPDHVETWDWQFDPTGGYKPETKTVLQVVAMQL